ncbi:MAG: epoxyqueuosine reductase [Dethiobacter sp.]|jgi:epoxyqueuosine reductase QueG|nr:epoxyqueuosine reductase [Dethiobacter sp.]
MQSELSEILLREGASLVGFADLRGLPAQGRQGLDYGLSIAVTLDPQIINTISGGPNHPYHQEYKRANTLLANLSRRAADFLADQGFRAVPKAPTGENFDKLTLSTELPHKTVATRAGLGWIGKSALLINKQLGASFRLSSVLTDAVFETADPVNRSLCGNCDLCVQACPVQAILNLNWEAGMARDSYYSAALCYQAGKGYSAALQIESTICGICIAVCPWTKKFMDRAKARAAETGSL